MTGHITYGRKVKVNFESNLIVFFVRLVQLRWLRDFRSNCWSYWRAAR